MSNYQLSKTGAEIDAALDLAIEHETSKADVAGNLPAGEALHAQNADFASQIETDREIDDADEACPPIVIGTVGGAAEVQSGLMKFEELRGNTIKWNQLLQNGNFPNTDGWQSRDTGASLSASDNICTLSVRTAGVFTRNRFGLQTAITGTVGHKYFVTQTVKSTVSASFATDLYSRTNTVSLTANEWKRFSFIQDVNNLTDGKYYFYNNEALTLSVGDTLQITNINVIDLTYIYGAGNEPSTVAEFVRDFPMPYYPYNAGTPMFSESASLISVGKNQCPGLDEYFPVIPGETYEVSGISAGGYLQEFDGNLTLIKTSSEITSATDITLDIRTLFCKVQATTYTNVFCYILWSTPGESFVEYESTTVTLPNLELRSVPDFANNATICDVAYQAGGGTRKVGIVDLGTLDWQYSSQNGRFYVSFSGIKYKGTDAKTNMLCSKYETSTYSANEDKTISGASSVGVLYVKDSAYSDAATFKAAMDGVMLVYELATETDITTTENPGWDEYIPVDNFGTLIFTQSPAQDIPVPQAYFIRYTVNPVEFLDALGENAGWDADNVALKSDIVVPDAPTTDGTYTLKVTVSNGALIYSWVADEE